MEEKEKRWRRAFFVLLITVILIIGMTVTFLMVLLFSKPEKIDDNFQTYKNPSFFTLTTNKASINRWIKEELSIKKQEFNNIHYEVVLEDYIYLKGYLLVFNREIPYQMVFEPTVNKDGSLTLHEKEISVGKLQLPGVIVLGLIQEQMKFPEWVSVIPNDHQILVDVEKIKLEKGLKLKVKRFDLVTDVLEFELNK